MVHLPNLCNPLPHLLANPEAFAEASPPTLCARRLRPSSNTGAGSGWAVPAQLVKPTGDASPPPPDPGASQPPHPASLGWTLQLPRQETTERELQVLLEKPWTCEPVASEEEALGPGKPAGPAGLPGQEKRVF